jgi:hypothetical protein
LSFWNTRDITNDISSNMKWYTRQTVCMFMMQSVSYICCTCTSLQDNNKFRHTWVSSTSFLKLGCFQVMEDLIFHNDTFPSNSPLKTIWNFLVFSVQQRVDDKFCRYFVMTDL